MNKAYWLLAPLAGWLVSASLASTPALAADSERVALEAAIQRWTTAVNAQDLAGLNATMTEDVELLDDTMTVTGRDAAIRALREPAMRGPLGSGSGGETFVHTLSAASALRANGLTKVFQRPAVCYLRTASR